MKKVIESLNSNLNDNDSIVVACSAGPDSMCLLSLIMQLNKNIKIIVAHVNHNVREISKEEYKYVEKYCNDNNLIFEGISLNNLSTKNFEAIARKKRYEFFNDLKEKYNAKYILTAHHGDDLIETILMRITRGSNLSGYAGIKEIDNNFYRPLLNTNKDKIIEYLEENNIKYYIDVTNNEDIHTRNRYRHSITPFLKKESKNIYSKYLSFSKELLEYDKFVREYIINKQIINNNIINVSTLINETDFIKKKTIEILIQEYQKDATLEISNNTVNEILNLINNDKPNVSVDLNNNFAVVKNYDNISIEKKQIIKDYVELFDNYFENINWIIKKEESKSNSNYELRLNSKEIKLPLIIRNKNIGDIIEIKNSGHKKIKDIFIDSKISLDERKTWPIVTDSNGTILWVPGLKKSKFDKNINEKCDIILTGERKDKNE